MSGELEHRVRDLVAAGDVGGAATLAIRGLGPPVLHYLRALLRDEEDAKDAFSQWAEGVWRGLGEFRGDSPLRAWAFRVAYHAALGIKRQAWRRHGRRLESGEASRIAEMIRTATGVRVERQRRVLHELRRRLTVEEQTLVQLRVDEGLSWTEMAEVLAGDGGRPEPNTLAKRFERIKSRLARMLKHEGLAD